jgi:hypothetical protein
MIPLFETQIIPANGCFIMSTPAKVLTVKTCTLPMLVSQGGGSTQDCRAGTVIDMRPNGFDSLNFINKNSVAVTIGFFIGDVPVAYQPADNTGANAATYIFGDLGIPPNSALNAVYAGSPVCDANGFLQISGGAPVAVKNTNNGHRRQAIIFTMSPLSPAALNILDANNCAFMTILAGDKIEVVTDAALTLSGAGGAVAWVTVGEIYLQNN